MNPTISFGRPIIKSIGVSTERLFNAYRVEGGEQEAADEFGIRVEDIQAAVKFENALERRILH